MEEALKQQPSDCIKVVLFGPESTGKTTLSIQLARHYNSVWVPEYARDYLQEKWKNVVQNKYFISWYAYKLQWHFINGPSVSEIISSKLITT